MMGCPFIGSARYHWFSRRLTKPPFYDGDKENPTTLTRAALTTRLFIAKTKTVREMRGKFQCPHDIGNFNCDAANNPSN
jgi:hypothetical protein